MRHARALAAVVFLSMVVAGYSATKWSYAMSRPLSPAASELIQIFERNAPLIAEKREPLVVVESEVCSHFTVEELDAVVSEQVPFFHTMEKRVERGDLVWWFLRAADDRQYLFRILMRPDGTKCQASIQTLQ